jgi:hypothetical protein
MSPSRTFIPPEAVASRSGSTASAEYLAAAAE